MADLDKQFRTFNDTIKLGWKTQLETLRTKRDVVYDRVLNGLPEGVRAPGKRNQGSYAMGTGIFPLEGDYDIDVALEFELDPAAHDPVAVKRWVYDAVEDHTSKTAVREPCVTVWWQRKGEPIYHVDLAVYAVHEGNTYLARGKLGASEDLRRWEPADPKALIEHLKKTPSDEVAREQQRRVIRYLKRWKDLRFSATGEEAPRGIALTACALRWFEARDSELDAVLDLVSRMHDAGEDIQVFLPVPPGNDLFAAMNAQQRQNLHGQLGKLRAALETARDETRPRRAAEGLRAFFGDDFPLPGKTASGLGAAAIGSSGASA